jgi:NADPH-dependent 2,4-dienoyl-CoA reductase/sulfur reductase-like enzyme
MLRFPGVEEYRASSSAPEIWLLGTSAVDYHKKEKTMKSFQYLIIGGGMAADAAVKGIRKNDEGGTIGILSAEPDPPYARPPLSKGLWKSDGSLDDIWLATERKGAELELATRAVSLNPGKKEVVDDRGRLFRYDRLLLATGGVPKRLSIGADDRVIYY